VAWPREMTSAALVCGSCGKETAAELEVLQRVRCARLRLPTTPAKYKQVTVLFADVVHSMDLAAALEMERYREVMTELVGRSAAVVQRYGGGDGGSPPATG